MTDLTPEQCRLLIAIQDKWKEFPQLRFGQLLTQIIYNAVGSTDGYYVTDIKLIEAARLFPQRPGE